MKLKTAYVIYYLWDRDWAEEINYLRYEERVEFFDSETKFASRLYELRLDQKVKDIEVYSGSITKVHEQNEV